MTKREGRDLERKVTAIRAITLTEIARLRRELDRPGELFESSADGWTSAAGGVHPPGQDVTAADGIRRELATAGVRAELVLVGAVDDADAELLAAVAEVAHLVAAVLRSRHLVVIIRSGAGHLQAVIRDRDSEASELLGQLLPRFRSSAPGIEVTAVSDLKTAEGRGSWSTPGLPDRRACQRR
ncbi:hypothetical protein JOF29_002878 [Kribbella aluminosa]|uniref:CdaR GGDEF-like domain-containing protein n=1 Tax=Kribbella aluminosa TaxID=416017 RepID=A0ABS4UJL8_9ACTN|nr:hypothetical protein [Kribbella aluminosa]MBP2351795.1 hypothetical protein [Kribbella aluminosa]